MSHAEMHRPSLEGLFELRQQQYLQASAVALLIYDYLTTFGDEVTFVWRRPKGRGTVLYVLNRYPAFVDLTSTLCNTVQLGLSQQQCTLFEKAEGYSFMVGICIAEVMMSMRVWTLWGSTRCMAVVLSVLWVASIVAVSTTARDTFTFAPVQNFTPMSGCYRSGFSNEFLSYAVLMGFEAVILTLTLVKCLKHSQLRGFQLFYPSSLFDLFIRDGVIYFVGVLIASSINAVLLHGDSQADITAMHDLNEAPTDSNDPCIPSWHVGSSFIYVELRQQPLCPTPEEHRMKYGQAKRQWHPWPLLLILRRAQVRVSEVWYGATGSTMRITTQYINMLIA